MLDIEAGCKASRENFPHDINPENGRVTLGEVFICKTIAKAQAAEYGHSPEREYAFLFLHGLLHLFGYDHVDENQCEEMEALQERVLSELKILR
jgi:probable rRNA maturation factor